MSYTSRHRYKNRREKFIHTKKKAGIVLIVISIILFLLAVYFWEELKDWYYVTLG